MPQSYYCQKQDYNCPICNTILQPSGKQYTIDQLFTLWKPIEFSNEVIDAHCKQSNYTELYSCSTCELEIFLPQIIGTSEFYKESYNLDNIKNKNALPYSEDKWEFQEIQNNIKNINSLIEIGCGNGAFLEKIKKSIPYISGIEYNDEAIKISRNRGFEIYHFNEINLIQQKFECAVAFHVLEHVSNPKEFIRSLLNLINDNGTLHISVPNQDGPIKLINPCIHNMPPHHATRWHKKTFEVLAQKLNLSIEEIKYEPLTTHNHYYYTTYWINSHIIGNSIIAYLYRALARRSLTKFFEFLNFCNIKYFKLLQGQSIYIIFKKEVMYDYGKIV